MNKKMRSIKRYCSLKVKEFEMKKAPVFSMKKTPQEAGTLYRDDIGSRGLFEYNEDYSKNGEPLDRRELRNISSKNQKIFPFILREGLPGVIADTGPESWGRHVLSQKYGKSLDAFDALIFSGDDGVGNIVVGNPEEKERFVSEDIGQVCRAIKDLAPNQNRVHHSINTALGGAKPKASLIIDGEMWIAKFPNVADTPNLPFHESTAMDMGRMAGIKLPRPWCLKQKMVTLFFS